MTIQILDNSLFDDGSLDCKSWVIATQDDCYYTSWKAIKRNYPEFVPLIEARVRMDEYYLSCEGIYDGVIEVQWD